MYDRVRICLYTPSSAAADLFASIVQTSTVDLEKRLEESEKVLNDYKKKIETITKNVYVKEFYIGTLIEYMVREKSERSLAEQEK